MTTTEIAVVPARTSSRSDFSSRSVLRTLIDFLRGALVGVTEVIPGVSGGTVALIVGIYETMIDGAGHLARAVACLIRDGGRARGRERALEHVRAVRWSVVLPVGIGMLTAVFLGAKMLSPIIEANPTTTRAIFAGLITASLIVPIRMTGARWRPIDVLIAVASAVVVFLLMGLPAMTPSTNPPLLLIGCAAAFAICALVLPGVSGSYILLTLGLYAPTLAAVSALNVPYIATFALGGIIGLGLFVPVLQWLLANRRRITLVIMTGLMAGSLRAVWPWQTEDGAPLPTGADWPLMLGLFGIGAAIVIALLAAESALLRRRLMSHELAADPHADVVIDEIAEEHELDEIADSRAR